ncbi:MAG TPA: bacillithiol biosynthesis cysteine-adding enzyme BshC [Sphingobacteriaceae bacterium]|nr:bacillithiol biosynthesis cysteine-adding enzyme BshC [Sphingobacteriaceae bacterium]
MKATCIDYKDTESFSPAVIRYIEGDPALAPFITYPPHKSGFQQALSDRKVTADRTSLVQVLKEQYSKSKKLNNQNTQRIEQNIELLLLTNTFTVTTGHQLNIFTGPLYFIYKIVTAINLASDLKKQFPEKNFVPIYWMASEDHDFAEINHTHIGGKKINWEQQNTGATGRFSIESINAVLAEYKSVLGYSDHAKKLGILVDDAYTEDNLAAATRTLVNGLFADYGLVILNADHHKLKKQFTSIITRDIIEQCSFKNIEITNLELEKTGIEAQVNPREINFFYLLDNLRERVVFEDNKYMVLNSDIKFTREGLLEEIAAFPERFSPNVVLRPLYQETILPNIAYIGGGAEIIYWLQLKRNFDFYKIDFPVLILRNSALVVDEKFEKKLSKLGLSIKEIFKNSNQLKKEWTLEHSEHELKLVNEWQQLESVFKDIKNSVSLIDPTLGPSAEAIRTRLHKAVQRLEKKLLKAEKRNHSEVLGLIDNLKEQYFSHGLQERHENFGLFYAKYGDEFIESLVKAFKPLDFKFTILYPE